MDSASSRPFLYLHALSPSRLRSPKPCSRPAVSPTIATVPEPRFRAGAHRSAPPPRPPQAISQARPPSHGPALHPQASPPCQPGPRPPLRLQSRVHLLPTPTHRPGPCRLRHSSSQEPKQRVRGWRPRPQEARAARRSCACASTHTNPGAHAQQRPSSGLVPVVFLSPQARGGALPEVPAPQVLGIVTQVSSSFQRHIGSKLRATVTRAQWSAERLSSLPLSPQGWPEGLCPVKETSPGLRLLGRRQSLTYERKENCPSCCVSRSARSFHSIKH